MMVVALGRRISRDAHCVDGIWCLWTNFSLRISRRQRCRRSSLITPAQMIGPG